MEQVGWVNQTAPLSFMENTKSEKPIRYFLYARKSTETEDRQVQSIDDQIGRLKELAQNLHLYIKKIYTESKSARKPNNRPVFDEMIERIENGEADGILCWQINRLTRNPIDSGKIQYLSQEGIIKSIQTINRQYLPDDNALLFSVEAGSANQFILDLKRNTKRGIDGKYERGDLPNSCPLGYLNDKENKVIIKDPERFNIIRKMWGLMLTGNYSAPKILKIATNEWGLRTRKRKKSGGRELCTSGIYKIFNSLFYTGNMLNKRNGIIYKGNHAKMITLEEYDRVQILLGRKGVIRPKTHEFPYTGPIRCGECGCAIVAETKTKLIKSTNEIKNFTYYHCTRKKKAIKCSQNKYLKEEILAAQIEEEVEKYTILPEFLEWALEGLNQKNDQEIEDRSKIYEMQQKAFNETQSELDELTRMRYRKLIGDSDFIRESNVLKNKLTKIKAKLKETEKRAEKWLELTEKTFVFATYARQRFIVGKLEEKKEILSALGITITLKDCKLKIEPNEWFVPILNQVPALAAEYQRLELNGKTDLTGIGDVKKEALRLIRTKLCRERESNPHEVAPTRV